MAGYMRLLRKEWRQVLPAIGLLVGAGSLAMLLLLGAASRLPSGLTLMLQLFVLGLAPVWALWQGYNSFRHEWSGNQSYLLLSLPVPGWWLITTKLLVIWAGVVLYGMVAGMGVLYALHRIALQEQLGLPPADVMGIAALTVHSVGRAIVYGLLACMAGAVIAQWMWLSGRLVPRWRCWMETLGFLLASWFVLRAVTVTGRLLGHWLPSAIFFQRVDWSQTPMVSGFQPSVAWAGVGVMLGMLLAGVLILLASHWVLEHEAEL